MRDSFEPEYLTVRQVADLSGKSTKTVWRAIKAHQLTAVRPGEGGLWSVPIQAYDAWMRGEAQPDLSELEQRTVRRAG